MKTNIFTISMAACVAFLASCSNDDNGGGDLIDQELNEEIISNFSSGVASSLYAELSENTATLNDLVAALEADPTDANLTACQDAWKQARLVWEQSESFLFGPVATESIDPRIDTWPVNFVDLEAQLSADNEFSAEYINDLEDALKGFHPIEYLLFGENGEKSAVSFTEREFAYLKGLSLNLKELTAQLADGWSEGNSEAYFHEFTTAGAGSTVYESQQDALLELVNAMAGICDEVANGKISEPFLMQDNSLEESPFSQNSITDFTYNIKGVQNVYLGKFAADGKGLEDLVKANNLQLDGTIKLKIDNAIAALQSIDVSFGQAIFDKPIQVQNAIDAINELKTVLEDELVPFVQQHSK